MRLNQIGLPRDMVDTLEAMYREVKNINPTLTEVLFLENVIKDWLEPYKTDRNRTVKTREEVVLRNNLQNAIKLSGKSQTQLAQEIGVSRCYIGKVIRGENDPSITVSLLLADALNYPPEKIKDLFFLEPTDQE